MRFAIRIFLLVCIVYSSAAQKSSAPVKQPAAGTSSAGAGKYISVTLTPLKNSKIYLGSYLGKGRALVDSAMLDDKSHGVFKGTAKYTPGVYFLVTPQLTPQFEFLMDDKQHFSITGDTMVKDNAVITGSLDNDLFKTYSQFSIVKGKKIQELRAQFQASRSNKADSARILAELTRTDKELQDYRNNIIKQYPHSLLAVFLNTMKIPTAPVVAHPKNRADSIYPYMYVKEHYWDDVLFNDDRLLRTPFFESKMDDYFKYYVSPEPDSIIKEVSYILAFAKSGKEIYPYLLTKFTNKYINPEYMGQDRVFVYLYENYYAKGDTVLLSSASRKTITERAFSLMTNQLGQPAPVLDLTDTTGKNIQLYGISAPFTMVVFWDPNCGHCKEEIPRLDSIYRAKWKDLGVSVYSVNIYENEITAWKKFMLEKSLSPSWIQVYETKAAKEAIAKAGQMNYRQSYDVFKTPTMYLLDKDKHIIAKQLSIEQFDELIAAKVKQQ